MQSSKREVGILNPERGYLLVNVVEVGEDQHNTDLQADPPRIFLEANHDCKERIGTYYWHISRGCLEHVSKRDANTPATVGRVAADAESVDLVLRALLELGEAGQVFSEDTREKIRAKVNKQQDDR